MIIGKRYKVIVIISALFLASVIAISRPAMAAEDEGGQGPFIMITYQAEPRDRAAVREYASSDWRENLNRWRGDKSFADYRLLVNSYVDAYTWDVKLILQFNDYAQVENWNAIERRYPSGLDPSGMELLTPEHTYLANRFLNKRAEGSSQHDGVYFVIPYAYRSEGEYKNYVQVYVQPQFEAWVDSGIAVSYEVFLNRHPTGKPWDSLLVIQYKDTKSFGERDNLKWATRAELKDIPSWKLISDVKHDFRTEWETAIAEPIRP